MNGKETIQMIKLQSRINERTVLQAKSVEDWQLKKPSAIV